MKSLLVLIISTSLVLGIKEDDLVKTMPGLNYPINFKVYSGYLNANADASWQMHYTLTESKSNASTDPLLVWFNGGPGCSSYAGLFEELGPFYINQDGATLYENIYSWNAKANVLYLESPIGVGYSYNTKVDGFINANDQQTADMNFAALADFFSRVQPQYAGRTFFLSGESYAGVYIPMLSSAITDAYNGVNGKTFPNPNFQGAAIGNGFMNVRYLLNSLVLWSAYHGRVSVQDWDAIKVACKTQGAADVDSYDFSLFTYSPTGNNIDFVGDNTACGKLINPLITMPSNMDPYNFYQDCYDNLISDTNSSSRWSSRDDFIHAATGDKNTANLYNYISTDNQWGYTCWNEGAVYAYSNRRDVQDALNIPQAWRNQNNGTFKWTDCNDGIYNQYQITYNTTYQFFNNVLKNLNVPNFRFLIYNGDVDTVCNYLGDAWHIRDVANQNGLTTNKRTPWFFSKNSQVAGYVQTYSGTPGKQAINIDLLTVKGAGHFVPNDRPGPSVQMITNFMFPTGANGMVDYSSTANVNPLPTVTPLNPTNATTGATTGAPIPTSSASTPLNPPSATTSATSGAPLPTVSQATQSTSTKPVVTTSLESSPSCSLLLLLVLTIFV